MTPEGRKTPNKPRKALEPKETGAEPDHGQASSAIAAALQGVDFPATKGDIIQEVGRTPIPLDEEHTVSLAQVLHRVPGARWAHPGEVRSAVNEHWDDIARWLL